jgi:hypothetical protein
MSDGERMSLWNVQNLWIRKKAESLKRSLDEPLSRDY